MRVSRRNVSPSKTEDSVKRVPGAGYRITYDWSFGDGETVTTDKTVVGHTFVKSGSYNVTMTATDQYGNTSTDTKTITAGVPPVEIGLKVSSSNKATRVGPVSLQRRFPSPADIERQKEAHTSRRRGR